MKIEKVLVLLVFVLNPLLSNAQYVENILHVPFDTIGGIKTEISLTTYGLKGFSMMDSNRVALLCDSERKVKIFDLRTSKMLYEFPTLNSPSHITFDPIKSVFYIGDKDKVLIYNTDGFTKTSISFDNKDFILYDIVVNNDDVYIQGVRQIYTPIIDENLNQSIKSQNWNKLSGQILDENMSISTYSANNKNGKYNLSINTKDISTNFEIPIQNDSSKVLFPIGLIETSLIVMERCGNNMDVESLIIYDLETRKRINHIFIPQIEFTYLTNSIQIHNNNIYHLLSTPDGAYLFKISPPAEKQSTEYEFKGYPNKFDYSYHSEFYYR